MPSRWDYLFERKAVPLAEHLLEEVSKLLAKDLARWPLPIQELDLDTGQQFASLLEPDASRPSTEVYGEAFRVAQWELERELAAVDDYMRNKRWLERGLAPNDKLAILFISRWVVEQLLALREATESRITRPMLVDCMDRTRRQLTRAGRDA